MLRGEKIVYVKRLQFEKLIPCPFAYAIKISRALQALPPKKLQAMI
jgi:hypothetical protein